VGFICIPSLTEGGLICTYHYRKGGLIHTIGRGGDIYYGRKRVAGVGAGAGAGIEVGVGVGVVGWG